MMLIVADSFKRSLYSSLVVPSVVPFAEVIILQLIMLS